MSDVVSGLLAKLSEVEKLANDCIAYVGSDRVGDEYADGSGTADRDDFPSYPWGSGDLELAFMAGPGHPDAVLRLCRAHRDLIEQAVEALRLIDDNGRIDQAQARAEHVDSDAWDEIEATADVWLSVLQSLARGLGVEEQSSE